MSVPKIVFKALLPVLSGLFFPFLLQARDSGLPSVIRVAGQQRHVQGITWDAARSRLYLSFTTRFVVTDSLGVILGSIDRIHGHLGAMTFDPVSRKVYASLECKDDVIGTSISDGLGEKAYTESSFYVAEIDVDAVTGLNVPQEDAIRRIPIQPAIEDYAAQVEAGGRVWQHRYACSGIDGVSVAPGFGRDTRRYLYVAYGIYGDVGREDNDYQVLLRYPLGKWNSKPERFFVKTGNTSWGVQNLAYDAHTGLMFMAVYKGKKPAWPNYDLFAFSLSQKPVKGYLDGVPYQKNKVQILAAPLQNWYFRWGSTGLCPLGDGLWYISENGRDIAPDGSKTQYCNATLYRWDGETPFVVFR